jgi:hypothetical protein
VVGMDGVWLSSTIVLAVDGVWLSSAVAVRSTTNGESSQRVQRRVQSQ